MVTVTTMLNVIYRVKSQERNLLEYTYHVWYQREKKTENHKAMIIWFGEINFYHVIPAMIYGEQ